MKKNKSNEDYIQNNNEDSLATRTALLIRKQRIESGQPIPKNISDMVDRRPIYLNGVINYDKENIINSNEQDIIINGVINGHIVIHGKVIINGTINGSITCNDITINKYACVNGIIYSHDYMNELNFNKESEIICRFDGGNLNGEIYFPIISVKNGSVINKSIIHANRIVVSNQDFYNHETTIENSTCFLYGENAFIKNINNSTINNVLINSNQ